MPPISAEQPLSKNTRHARLIKTQEQLVRHVVAEATAKAQEWALQLDPVAATGFKVHDQEEPLESLKRVN